MYQINLQKSISYLCDPRELPNEGVYFLNNKKKSIYLNNKMYRTECQLISSYNITLHQVKKLSISKQILLISTLGSI